MPKCSFDLHDQLLDEDLMYWSAHAGRMRRLLSARVPRRKLLC